MTQYPHKNNFGLYQSKFSSYIKGLEKDKLAVSEILKAGVGVKTFIKNKKIKSDFKGLYAFWENGKIVYVGISRTVIARLYQHIKTKSHYTATFAVKIMRTDEGNEKDRAKITKDDFAKIMDDRISKMKFSYVKISCTENDKTDTELYLFEIYAAIHFQAKYNTFETH